MPAARGLRFDKGLVSFSFTPSIGLFARDVNKLGLDIRSFKEPLTRSVRQVMIPSIQQNFTVGGRPAWEPLSEATGKIREEAGYGASGPILVRSGALQRNMGFLSMWQVTSTFATIRDLPSRIWYGKLHQSGYGSFSALVERSGGVKEALAEVGTGREAKIAIPPRPFVMFQDQDVRDIGQVFSKWLDERIARSGAFRGVR
jgi:phage gpG-like protein